MSDITLDREFSEKEHWWLQVSGLYTMNDFDSTSGNLKYSSMTVRLDVDSWYPQMMASGTYRASGSSVYWLATHLEAQSPEVWEGEIIRRSGDTQLLPHELVRIHVRRQLQRKMKITFMRGASDISMVLEFQSPYFHTVEFEFDSVETAPRVTTIDPWAHPSRPINLSRENLNISKVYSRAGLEVQQSPNTSVVGLEAGGVGAEIWSDQQLHDAMRTFWSRYKPRAQWALWMLFAHRHICPKLSGVMFDHSDRTYPSDPVQRQGAAIFVDKIAEALPPGEKNPHEWIRREQFFAVVHELGHCFNLAHSWQKAEGNWAFDPGDPRARSFMNYPFRVENFFDSFHYRFDDQELAFMRHAPEEFVMMGGAFFGRNHGFGDGRFATNSSFVLELKVDRTRPVFEFLEPIAIELKLTNVSRRPQLVNSLLLDEVSDLTLIIQSCGGSREWRPYARYCSFEDAKLLQPMESLKASLFASAGLDGWYLAEPGSYTLRAHLHSSTGRILSEPLKLRVAAPRSWEEDYLAQNFFTDEVGRTLAFGGTHVMTSAIEVLQDAADRFKHRAVSRHANLALALPLMQTGKVLRLPDGEAPMSSVAADGGRITAVEARPDDARRMLHEALLHERCMAIETFGPIAYRRLIEMYANWLELSGDVAAAGKARAPLSEVTGALSDSGAVAEGEG